MDASDQIYAFVAKNATGQYLGVHGQASTLKEARIFSTHTELHRVVESILVGDYTSEKIRLEQMNG